MSASLVRNVHQIYLPIVLTNKGVKNEYQKAICIGVRDGGPCFDWNVLKKHFDTSVTNLHLFFKPNLKFFSYFDNISIIII